MTGPDLAPWLLAQLDEDEQHAGDMHDVRHCAAAEYDPQDCDCGNPMFVLADIAVKRRIIALHTHEWPHAHECPKWMWRDPDFNDPPQTQTGWAKDDCQTLRLLALPYAHRPGYDPAWTPEEPT